MASVPNMSPSPAMPMPEGAASVEGEGAELFARILSQAPFGGPGSNGEISAELDEATARDGAEGEEAAPVLAPTVPDLLPIIVAQNAAPVAVNAPLPAEEVIPPAGDAMPGPPAVIESDPEAPDSVLAAPVTTDDAPQEVAVVPASSRGVAVKAAVMGIVPAGQSPSGSSESDVEPSLPPADTRAGRPESLGQAVKAAIAALAADRRDTAKPLMPPGSSRRSAPVDSEAQANRGNGDAPAIVSTSVPASAAFPMVTATSAVSTSLQGSRAPAPQTVAEQLTELELDLAHEGEWLDRLARDIARVSDGEGSVRFRLHPQSLGHLRVELAQNDQGTSIRLTAETEAARAILADAQPRLLAEARAQGLKVSETHVDLAGSGDRASDDPRRQDDGRQPLPIRTARGLGRAAAATEASTARSERYA